MNRTQTAIVVALIAAGGAVAAALAPRLLEPNKASEASAAPTEIAAPTPPPTRECSAQEREIAKKAIVDYGSAHHICVDNAKDFIASIDLCYMDNATSLMHIRGQVDFSDSLLQNQNYALTVSGTSTLAAEADMSTNALSTDYENVCKFNKIVNAVTAPKD